jgi:DNA-binding CsgD family transcriptional regulator
VSGAHRISRQDALDATTDLAVRVQAHRASGAVHIVGEAGIGKSTTVAAAVEVLRERGFALLDTALTAAETPLLWTGLHGLLDDDVPDAALAALPVAQRRAIDSVLGRLVTDPLAGTAVEPGLTAMAFAAIVERLTDDAPLAIVVDDLHWLDTATAGVLAFGMRANRRRPVLLMSATRPSSPVPLEPDRLVSPERYTEIELVGLTEAATQDLLTSRFGVTLRRPDLIRVCELTGGNPLHITEIGRELAGGASIEDAARTTPLRQAIEDRLAQLEPAVVKVVELCALLASPTVDVIERASEADLTRELEVAEGLGVVDVVGSDVRFTHPLFRAALLDRMGGAKRRSFELRLATVVHDEDERALLLSAAASGPDPEIADLLDAAARRAQLAGATSLAIERMTRCLALTPGGDQRGVERYLRASEWMMASGDAVGARDAARRAETLATTRTDRAAARLAQLAPTAVLSILEAPAVADDLITEFGDEPELQVPMLLTAAKVTLRFDLSSTLELAKRALAVTTTPGAAHPAARELVELVKFLMGEPNTSDGDQDNAATAPNETWATVLPLVWADRHDEAIALCAARIQRDEERGNIAAANNSRDQLCDAYWRSGRWSDAEREMERWRDLERTFGNDLSTSPGCLDHALLYAATGRPERAAELISLMAPHVGALPPTLEFHARAAVAAIAVVDQRWQDAIDNGRRARTIAASIGLRDVVAVPYHHDLVEALLRVGEVDEAHDVATEHVRLAAQAGRMRGLVESAHSRAIVHAAHGDLDDAFAAFEQALAVVDIATIPLAHARVLLSLGAVLRKAGRRARSAVALDEADDLFERLGAVAWRRRVAEQRARSAARPVPGALTPTQTRITELVARGHTNAMIAAELSVSLRTVESNLTNIYRRLGVRSRTGLIARLTASSAHSR